MFESVAVKCKALHSSKSVMTEILCIWLEVLVLKKHAEDQATELWFSPDSRCAALAAESFVRQTTALPDLALWAERITPFDTDELPPGLLSDLPAFDDPVVAELTFTPVSHPVGTTYLPRAPPQRQLHE
eukprot:423778-Pleurochrysis_carterae.AAC.1